MRALLLLAGIAPLVYCTATLLWTRLGGGHILLVALALPPLAWGLFYDALNAWAAQGVGALCLFCLRTGYALTALCVAVCCVLMVSACAKAPEPNAQAMIVLGAGLRDGRPSQTLARRLDAAYAYMQENPYALCVLSGGLGADEPVSEAEAMRRYMIDAGLPQERLLLEDRSVNTAQNIAFSREVLRGVLGREPGAVVVVTSDFHLFRGVALARGAGLQAQGLASPSRPVLLPLYALRETAGILKDALMGRL